MSDDENADLVIPNPLEEYYRLTDSARAEQGLPPWPPELCLDQPLDDETTARREAKWRAFAPRVGVPKRLLDASLRTANRTPTIDRAIDFVNDEFPVGRCLVLTGPTGIGKSFAAVAALRACSDTGTQKDWRWFVYFPALCGALLDPARRREALTAAKLTPLVVFDDFGVEYAKEGGLVDAFLDEIVWTREAEELPTIITTNLTTEQLKQRLPGRLVDRLRGEWGRVFECPGESLRSA